MRLVLSCGLLIVSLVFNAYADSSSDLAAGDAAVGFQKPVTESTAVEGPGSSVTPNAVVNHAAKLAVDDNISSPAVAETAIANNNERVGDAGTAALPTDPNASVQSVPADDRVAVLERAVSLLQHRLIFIEERLAQLEGKVISKPNIKQYSNGLYGYLHKYTDVVRGYIGESLFITLLSGFIILLLSALIYLITSYNRTNIISIANYPKAPDNKDVLQHEEDGEVEMDNAAKMNLARAYIDMGDEGKAKEILYEVLAHGSDDEQAEAKALIEKIKDQSI